MIRMQSHFCAGSDLNTSFCFSGPILMWRGVNARRHWHLRIYVAWEATAAVDYQSAAHEQLQSPADMLPLSEHLNNSNSHNQYHFVLVIQPLLTVLVLCCHFLFVHSIGTMHQWIYVVASTMLEKDFNISLSLMS